MLLRNIFIPIKTGVSAAPRLIAACFLLGVIALSPAAWAANVGIGSGTRIEVPLKSMKDLRDQRLVKQRFDYSCGAAALATVLRYGFGDEVTERDILTELFDLLPEDEEGLRRKEGFSLLDLDHPGRNPFDGHTVGGKSRASDRLPINEVMLERVDA